MKSSVQFAPNKHWENISRMFRKLYNDEQLADVTLCCKDGTIKAHKLILATSSPYFHKIFTENSSANSRDHFILIMHGISYQTLKDLIELIYKGNVDVSPESMNRLYDLAGEFQLAGLSGVLRGEESDKNDNGSHGRDTRFKGLKRVAVDYKDDENLSSAKKLMQQPEIGGREPPPGPPQLAIQETATVAEPEPPKLSAWAKKQRKFKCDLCPSSFKRSSHLTRHQLVHTGERPFACERCDKAFSRHDKLKHHIRKSHDNIDDLESDHVRTATPSPLPFVISNVRTEQNTSEEATPTVSQADYSMQKRPRGRPRKYPLVEKPLIKRGRGRPRLNRMNETNGENYDITNLPYGDLEYLTMPLQDSAMMEPLVEIKTEKDENCEEKLEENEKKSEENNAVIPVELQVLENKIAKIGECTISVANH